MSSATNPATPPPTRRPYHGSCHCGATRYIAYLTLPPAALSVTASPSTTVRMYKCNCTACHKMSFFHIRLQHAPTDFQLLAPLDPDSGLTDYMCSTKRSHWYFCRVCGVRCFATDSVGEVREEVVGGETVRFWAPRREGWVEDGEGCYFTVNAATLEPGQEGLSLKEWTEKGWFFYMDYLEEKGEYRYGEPHDGGIY